MRDGARTITLADVRVGERAVLAPDPVLDTQQAQRLVELGLRPGVTVRVMMRTAGGGRILGVDGLRIVLDRSTLRAVPVSQGQTAPGTLPAPGEHPPPDEDIAGRNTPNSQAPAPAKVPAKVPGEAPGRTPEGLPDATGPVPRRGPPAGPQTCAGTRTDSPCCQTGGSGTERTAG